MSQEEASCTPKKSALVQNTIIFAICTETTFQICTADHVSSWPCREWLSSSTQDPSETLILVYINRAPNLVLINRSPIAAQPLLQASMSTPSFLVPTLPRPRTTIRHTRTPKCNLPNHVPSDQLNTLRTQLSAAITAQNFTLAAQLRDEIANLEQSASDELAVSLANEAFYEALHNADMDAMGLIWLPSDSVSCAFATSGFQNGYDDVLASWRRAFTAGRPVDVEVDVVSISVRRNVAWVICRQVVTAVRGSIDLGGERVVTNIFQKRRGKWMMVHHHASPTIVVEEASPQPPSTE